MIFALLFTLFIDILIYVSNSFSFEIKDYMMLSLLTFACVYIVFRIGEKILIKESKKEPQKRPLISNIILTVSLIILIPAACFVIFSLLWGLFYH